MMKSLNGLMKKVVAGKSAKQMKSAKKPAMGIAVEIEMNHKGKGKKEKC